MIELGIGRSAPPEIRVDATALAISALVASVGTVTARTWASAAVELAAGMWARCLSTADVPPDVPIGPRWLAEVGRDLARRGEVVYLVDVAPMGRLRLLRATSTDVWGDSPDPRDWWYRLTVTSPRSTRTVTAPASSVVHVRYATEPHSPARGVSPLQYAALTGTLTANLEQSLGHEAGGAVAQLIALPEGFNAQPPTEDGSDQDAPLPADTLALSIRGAKGRTLLPETTASGYGAGKDQAPRKDWKPERLGANPPQALVQLRQHVEASVLGCYGIPAPLGPAGLNDGTAAREALRRLWTITIAPLASLITEELTRVLERPIQLEHGAAAGTTDIAARARAVKALTDAGIDKADALKRVGW